MVKAIIAASCAITLIGCSPLVSVSGTVTGVVRCGPTSPQGNGIVPASDLDVYFSASGQTDRSVRTDAFGRYRMNLPPGAYRVTLGQPNGIGLAIVSMNGTQVKGRSWTVPIRNGEVKTLNLICDTGIL